MSDIVNPYIAGSPVTGSEMFFGREDIFDFVRHTLIGRHRDNVIVLYGQRRTGKTSVLYQMRSHLGEHYLPIFADLHGFALKGIDGFLWELANHIRRILRRDYQIDLPFLNQDEFMTDPRSVFENVFLNNILAVIGDRHILLMLDEAVRLEEQVLAGKLEHEIFEYLRHLMQHYEWLNFLFSLGSGLEEMEKEYAFLFSVGLYKKISFLDRDSAIALITQPVKDCYQVEPAALERILQITSGQPYYTQLLCHCLFNRWRQECSASIEAKDVDEILDEVIERGLAVLKHVWDESTLGEKAVMAGIAAAMGSSNCPVGVEDINRAWSRYDVAIPKGDFVQAIRSLTARDVISGQEIYVFTVDLQRLWLQKYKRLEWVEEEIIDTVQGWSTPTTTVLQRNSLLTKPSTGRMIGVRSILLIVLALVLIVGGFGTFYIARSNSIDATIAQHATATAQAQVRAIATVSFTYPFSTKLVFDDQMNRSNSNNYWDKYTANTYGRTGQSCQFKQGAYYATEASPPNFFACFNEGPVFSNFTYEVNMKIITGDCGGLAFRGNATTGNFYYFRVCQSGSYTFSVCENNSVNYALLKGQSILGFRTGPKQSNVIAVVARENTLDLYANGHRFDGVTAHTYSQGEIGLTAGDVFGHSTEVEYSDVRVWTL